MTASSRSLGDATAPPLVGVFLVALSSLAFEISLTRLFSVIVHYNYVFLAVSIAICGLGLGASFVHLQRTRRPVPGAGNAKLWAVAYALTSAASTIALVRWLLVYQLHNQVYAGLLLLIPFGCVGAFFASAFADHPNAIGRLYASDLVGAGAGAVGVVALLHLASPVDACLVTALLAALAAVSMAGPRADLAWLSAAVCGGLLAANLSLGILAVSPPLRYAAGASEPTFLFNWMRDDAAAAPEIVHTEWNPVARTDVVRLPEGNPHRDRKSVFYMDGRNPTDMIHVDADLRTAEPATALSGMAPLLSGAGRFAFSVRPMDRVLSIGPGGGADVILALMNGATRIEGAELNPSILPLMARFADRNGHLYAREGISVVAADGRDYVRRSSPGYDLIFAALSLPIGAGATTLMDSYLYTEEAFRDYWDHLAPNGVLALVTHESWLLDRFVATAITLMREVGVEAATLGDHIVAAQAGGDSYNFVLLLRRRPFTAEESRALLAEAEALRLRPLFIPIEEERPRYKGVLRGVVSLERFATGSSFDLRPCTDDRPFCFDQKGGAVPAALRQILGATAALTLLVVAAGLWTRRRSEVASVRMAPFPVLFALLGLGYMLVEIALIQHLTRILGFGVLALVTVLGALLVGGGIGSFASDAFAQRCGGRGIPVAAGLSAALIAGMAGALSSLEPGLAQLPLAGRIAAVAPALAGLGFFLGMAFPLGLGSLARISPEDVPWMWALNGVFSVVGSLAAMVGGRVFGFTGVLLAAAVIYVAIALLSAHPRITLRHTKRVH